ncbi:MAG: CPBP family intramembrane metalloprotease [Oscillospiraceae bacterium]|nr:CPBP family intramembrane metalloprotease [Oscillospiraceae bacterium]
MNSTAVEKKNVLKKKITVGPRIKAVIYSISPMILYLAVTIIFAVVLEVAFPDNDELYDTVFSITDIASWVIAILIINSDIKKQKGVSVGKAVGFKSFDPVLTVMILLFGYCGAEVIDSITAYFLSGHMTVEPNRSLDGAIDVIHAVLIAPVAEEIVFRFFGIEYSKGHFNISLIMIANALYFTVLHGYNIQGFANVLVYGLASAYIYIKTGSLINLMIAHSLHNMFCCVDFGDTYYQVNGFNLSHPWWFAVNAVITAGVIVWYFVSFRKKYCKKNDTDFNVNNEIINVSD